MYKKCRKNLDVEESEIINYILSKDYNKNTKYREFKLYNNDSLI